MLSCRPHLSVEDWLRKLELSVYSPLLKHYNGVEDMLDLSERELKDMGILIGSHRARLVTSLNVLRKKYDRAYKSPNTSSGSLQVDSPNSKSLRSISPVSHINLETTSGVRSWPSSGATSLTHTRHSSHRSSMESGLGMEPAVEDLKKALEHELSLDSSDLRSFAWYHGTILRQRAEELVKREGDFIVRDCISQPGDFVITCMWQGQPLHFIVKKVLLRPHTVYEKIQYCFENDNFDSISDFITYYVGSRCPLSANCGAIIANPINRSMPLSYYASRYGVQCQIQYAAKALAKIPQSPKLVDDTPSLPTLPEKPQTPNEKPNALVSGITSPSQPVVQRRNLIRVGSDPSMNPNAERKTFERRPNSGTVSTEAAKAIASKIEGDKPPPKPSRVPSKRCSQKPLVIKRERKNTPPTPLAFFSESNDDRSPQLSLLRRGWPAPYKRMVSGETRFSFLDQLSVSDDGSDTETLNPSFTVPTLPLPSSFNPSDFQSLLISNKNQPLEGPVLSLIKKILLSETTKKLACHLMRVDLEVAKNFEDEDLGLGVTSGFEFIMLPQGQQLVNDLLERSHCMKLLVATTILTCVTSEERLDVLHRWINLATETKNTCGNFYGFTGIMLGLTMPQITCLDDTWHSLRRSYTTSAFAFETKLIPALKTMQAASSKVPPNTCIPYIMSLLAVLQQHLRVMENLQHNNNMEIDDPIFNFGIANKSHGDDFGLHVLEKNLDMGRNVLQQWPVFRNNAEITLKNVKYDAALLDIFRTEFHLRLLWGSRGAICAAKERHEKFEKVLDYFAIAANSDH